MIILFLFQKLVYIYLEHLLLYVQVRMFCINNLIISYNFHLYFYLVYGFKAINIVKQIII